MMRLLAGKWGASEPESIQIKNSRGETAAVWSCVLVCIASELHGLHGDDDENFFGGFCLRIFVVDEDDF